MTKALCWTLALGVAAIPAYLADWNAYQFLIYTSLFAIFLAVETK